MSRARNVPLKGQSAMVNSPDYQTGPRAPIITPVAEIKRNMSWGIAALAAITLLLTWMRYYFSGRDSNPFHDEGGMTHNEQLLAEGVLFVSFIAGLIGVVLVMGSLGEKSFDLVIKALIGTAVACAVALVPAGILMHGWVEFDWVICSLWLVIPFYTYVMMELTEDPRLIKGIGGIKTF